MPYIFQGLSPELSVAMGDFYAPPAPIFAFESAMPTGYVSEQMGLRVESEDATPIIHAGEIFTTAKGDFVKIHYTVTTASGESYETESVQVDNGGGAQSLQTVVETPVTVTTSVLDAPHEIIAQPTDAPPPQPFYSESSVDTNPLNSQQVNTAPEVVSPDFQWAPAPDAPPPAYVPPEQYVPYYGTDGLAYTGGNTVETIDPATQDSLNQYFGFV